MREKRTSWAGTRIRGDEVEAIGDMDMGIELDLVCNPTLKYVKELKRHRGRKGSGSVWFNEKGNPDIFSDWNFAQEHHQVLHPRVFWEEWIGSFS